MFIQTFSYYHCQFDFFIPAKIIKTMEKLECSNKEHYRIYDKRSLPKRYHHSATDRAGDVILDGQLGTMFFESGFFSG